MPKAVFTSVQRSDPEPDTCHWQRDLFFVICAWWSRRALLQHFPCTRGFILLSYQVGYHNITMLTTYGIQHRRSLDFCYKSHDNQLSCCRHVGKTILSIHGTFTMKQIGVKTEKQIPAQSVTSFNCHFHHRLLTRISSTLKTNFMALKKHSGTHTIIQGNKLTQI